MDDCGYIDNGYFYADNKMCRIKPSLYIRVIPEPLVASDKFKSTASFRQFLDGTFDYPMINMYEYSFNGRMLVVNNIVHVADDKESVKLLFKKFFARYLSMEKDPIDENTGSGYETWRRDVIIAECNHSFIKQHPKYSLDDEYRYSYINVQTR